MKKSKSGKKIISSMVCFMALIIGGCSFSISSFASDLPIYNLQFSEPSYGYNQGYINILTQNNSTNVHTVRTFFWITNGMVEKNVYQPLGTDIRLSSSGVTFGISALYPDSSVGVQSVFEITADGVTKYLGTASSALNVISSDWPDSQTLGYIVKGNVSTVSGSFSTSFSVSYVGDDVSSYVWQLIQEVHKSNELWSKFETEYLVNYLSALNTLVNESYKQSVYLSEIKTLTNSLLGEIHGWFPVLHDDLSSIVSELENIDSKLDTLIDEQKKSNSWLEKIWNSIREFINPTDEDKQKTDDYNSNSSLQKNEMDELNKDNQLDTPDIDDSSGAVDENIDYDSMDEYSGVLAVIVNNKFVIQMILISVSVVIIGYVLFGKR